MKYNLIFLNIKKLIKEQECFFLLLILSQIAACLAIFFAIGAIHNTRNEQKDIDIRTMYFEVYIEPISVENMQKKAERILTVIPENMLSYASIYGRTKDASYYVQLNANDDSVISTEQILNGEKVIGVSVGSSYNGKKVEVNDKIDFCGTEYTVISVGDYVCNYILPITAIDSSLPIDRFRVNLSKIPDKELAEEIQQAINEVFPITTENHTPKIPDLLTVQFNRTMIIASFIIIAVVAINLSYCYCYLFMKRKKTIAVYMICGCSNNSAANLMVVEAAVISFVCYMISFCIINPFITLLTDIYPAAENLYSHKFFVIVGVVYVAITVAVLKLMFSSLIRKSAVDLKRGV